MVGGVEGNGHPLATCGSHREGLCVSSANDINGNLEGCGREGERQRGKEEKPRIQRERQSNNEGTMGRRTGREGRRLTGVPCCCVGDCGKGTTACGKVQELLSLSVGHVTDHTPKHPGMKTRKDMATQFHHTLGSSEHTNNHVHSAPKSKKEEKERRTTRYKTKLKSTTTSTA